MKAQGHELRGCLQAPEKGRNMGKDKTTKQFRVQLKREVDRWLSDGVVNSDQARILSRRYALDSLPQESAGALVFAIYIIGAVLICCGVISFVAWHWYDIPSAGKLAIVAGLMLAAHAVGLHQWKITGRREILGHSLVVLGTLIFGANIALIADIFHISSEPYNGFGAWALGSLAMAYAAWSVPNGIIAVVASFAFWAGWMDCHHDAKVFSFYPYVAMLAFLPLTFLKRSAWMMFFSSLAIGFAVIATTAISGGPWACVFSGIGVGLLCYAGGFWFRLDEDTERMGAVGKTLGVAILLIAAYLLSFKAPCRDLFQSMEKWQAWWRWGTPMALAWIGAIVLLVPAVYANLQSKRDGGDMLGILAGGALLLTCLVVRGGVVGTILANAALVSLSAGLMWAGVVTLNRWPFWAGVVATLAMIVGRFFEYETGLLGKAAAFLLSGVGLMFGGVKFESYLRARRNARE